MTQQQLIDQIHTKHILSVTLLVTVRQKQKAVVKLRDAFTTFRLCVSIVTVKPSLSFDIETFDTFYRLKVRHSECNVSYEVKFHSQMTNKRAKEISQVH